MKFIIIHLILKPKINHLSIRSDICITCSLVNNQMYSVLLCLQFGLKQHLSIFLLVVYSLQTNKPEKLVSSMTASLGVWDQISVHIFLPHGSFQPRDQQWNPQKLTPILGVYLVETGIVINIEGVPRVLIGFRMTL